MKRILIGYDGSQGAEEALRDLKNAGFPDRSEALVFTVADVWLPPDPTGQDPVFPDRVAASRVDAHRHAVAAVEEARRTSMRGAEQLRGMFPGWIVHHSAKAESPAWGILAEARRWPAELVVVGSHGRSPLQRFFLGSVSYKIAAEAPCSVRIFRPRERQSQAQNRVVVGVDGSSDSKIAIDEVLSRDWPRGTEFHLVTVIDPKTRTAALRDDELIQGEDWVPAMLAGEAKKFLSRQLDVHTHVVDGDVKTGLLESAERWSADCIFLGARGIDHRDRLYLGTSASAIATRAHCTVEIVRPRVSRAP